MAGIWWLLTLYSELALLLVANGESETLAVLLPVGPDLILYIEDAGIFVINGRKFPGILRLISYNRESKRETTFNYPNAINWLPPRVGFGRVKCQQPYPLGLVNDKTNKEVILDEPLVANRMCNFT